MVYKYMVKEKFDLVFYFGDYIYEYGLNEYVLKIGNVCMYNSVEIIML